MAKRLFQQSLSDHCVGRSLSFGKVVAYSSRGSLSHKRICLLYPDNSIRIYECLENVRMISKLLSSNGVIIDEISVQGENLETYFENLIGGRKNV